MSPSCGNALSIWVVTRSAPGAFRVFSFLITSVSWCVVKAGGGLVDGQVCPSPVLCPGPSPDHVERKHQLDSWQTDRLFPCPLSPKCQGMWSSLEWGIWGIEFFVTSYGSPDWVVVGLWYNLWRQHFATYITPASGCCWLDWTCYSCPGSDLFATVISRALIWVCILVYEALILSFWFCMVLRVFVIVVVAGK